MQQPQLLDAFPQVVDELLALALRAQQIRHVPVDADHAHGPAVRVADGLRHAANDADRAVASPHPEIGPERAVAAERGLDVAGGTREVFRHQAPRPCVGGAAELLLANAIEPVHRVVPHEPILLHVPVPDTEPSAFDGELQPLFAHAQAGFAFLQLPLATLAHLDFGDQIVERRLERAGHVVERVREAVQLLADCCPAPARSCLREPWPASRAQCAAAAQSPSRPTPRPAPGRAPAPRRTPAPCGCWPCASPPGRTLPAWP